MDGETNYKLRQALPQTSVMIDIQDFQNAKGYTECQIPNTNLYEFVGSLYLEHEKETLSLGPDQILLRGAKLVNTKWIIGQAIYTGKEGRNWLITNPLCLSPVEGSISIISRT